MSLRYYFRYVAQLPEALVSASLVFGSAIHAAVERHYQVLLETDKPISVADLVSAYQEEWEKRSAVPVRFGKGESRQSLDQLAERMLEAFLPSEMARPQGRVLGVEEEFRASLVPGMPEFLGRIDLLVESEDELIVTDFKTAKTRWSQEQAQLAAGQLLLYFELVRAHVPRKRIRVQFAVLAKTKTPALELFPIGASVKRGERMKLVAQRVWKAIAAGHFYPVPSAMNCTGCPFRVPCKAWPNE